MQAAFQSYIFMQPHWQSVICRWYRWIYQHFIFVFFLYIFQPWLHLPYGSVYCFKFKIWYSRFYWSRSTKDPADPHWFVVSCGFALTSVGEYTKTKVSDRINAFLAIFWRKCLDGKFWQELKKNLLLLFFIYIYIYIYINIFFVMWLLVAIKTVTTAGLLA